jgi:ribosome maturation factor RimP
MSQQQKLSELLAPTVTGMEYEFVGLEYLSGAHPAVLRVYIDQPDGITVDDCALVSRQLSAVLDVEDPIAGEYNLEVSSPGLNRPLFTVEHFQQCIGERINLKLRVPQDGRRKYTGQLTQVTDTSIELMVDNKAETIFVADIEKANLIFDHSK